MKDPIKPKITTAKPTTKPKSKVAVIRDHWELDCPFERTSRRDMNSVDHLKMNSGQPPRRTVIADEDKLARSTVYATQRELAKRHYEAKSKLDGISGIGGGVSMWPAMDDMRLTSADTVRLAAICVVLVLTTVAVFYAFHGR